MKMDRPLESGQVVRRAVTVGKAPRFGVGGMVAAALVPGGGALAKHIAISAVRLARQTASNRWLPLLGLLACAAALAALLWHTWTTSPGRILVLAAMAGLSVAIEATYRAATGQEIRVFHPGARLIARRAQHARDHSRRA